MNSKKVRSQSTSLFEKNVHDLIICADDFAQNISISEAILCLSEHQRINAISCLVNTPTWGDVYSELITHKKNCFIGLHLNLTFGQPLSAMWRKYEGEEFKGLPNLLKKLYLKAIDQTIIAAEIQAQVDMFIHNTQCYPDFIDGHQHVHQMPMVRDVILELYAGHNEIPVENNEQQSVCFLRNTYNNWHDIYTNFPKAFLIALFGGRSFRQSIIQNKYYANTSFSGIYNFKKAKHYRHYFQTFLDKSRHGGLIMCHPGLPSKDIDDPLIQSRPHEFNYLMSDLFLTDLEDRYFQLMHP